MEFKTGHIVKIKYIDENWKHLAGLIGTIHKILINRSHYDFDVYIKTQGIISFRINEVILLNSKITKVLYL